MGSNRFHLRRLGFTLLNRGDGHWTIKRGEDAVAYVYRTTSDEIIGRRCWALTVRGEHERTVYPAMRDCLAVFLRQQERGSF